MNITSSINQMVYLRAVGISSLPADIALLNCQGRIMGRLIPDRDISSTLCAADRWIKSCLIKDESIFTDRRLWTAETIQDVHDAFVGNPDDSDDDFITKLQGQMARTNVAAQHLMGEMLWALLLFPSNIRTQTKRKRVRDVFGLSGQVPDEEHPFFHDDVLKASDRAARGTTTIGIASWSF